MSLLARFRQWCAKPFIEAELFRLAELVERNSADCKAIMESTQNAIYQQGFAAGQQYEHDRVFEMMESYISERDGKDLSDSDVSRARGFYRQ